MASQRPVRAALPGHKSRGGPAGNLLHIRLQSYYLPQSTPILSANILPRAYVLPCGGARGKGKKKPQSALVSVLCGLVCRGLPAGGRVFYFLLMAISTVTATATVAPTIGLLPIPRKPIISTWAGTEELPANCASLCMRPRVSVMP